MMEDDLRKIHIIGPPGSGKTHLAKQLSFKFNLPHYELDNISWRVKYSEKRSLEDKKSILEKIVNKNYWILEGVQTSFIENSICNADLIILLNFNFFILSNYKEIF